MAEPQRIGPDWVSADVPSSARVYDYLLGGGHNFPADRAIGDRLLEIVPAGEVIAGSNRAFLRRAVLFMIEAGITQFLDLGSGIPSVGNVHEVARKVTRDARVVYVDRDEVTVAYSELILAGDESTAIVQADICEPWRVLRAPEVTRLLDFRRPVGLLAVCVLHFVPDDLDPAGLVATYRNVLPAGSMIALSHVTAEHDPRRIAAVVEAMRESRDQLYPRSFDGIHAMFGGFELVCPGLVIPPLWRPELSRPPGAELGNLYAGVGYKH